jgi:hypothetical protein
MKKFALAALIAWAAVSAFALDLSGTAFTQTGSKDIDGKTLALLADQSGGEVLLDAEAEPSPDRLSALSSIVAEIRSWTDFQASEVRAVNTQDRLQVTALPKSFSVGGTALEAALPGGVQLFYKVATEYDFKVKSGKYLVRVASVFTTWAELESAILAAYTDPPSFIATRDPLYVQRRLGELATQADDLQKRLAALEGSPSTEGGTATAIDLPTLQADLQAVKTELQADEAVSSAFQAKVDGLLLTSFNGGKTINPDAVAKLIELKKNDPTLSKKTAPKALKDAGITLDSGAISAIFFVEFGER